MLNEGRQTSAFMSLTREEAFTRCRTMGMNGYCPEDMQHLWTSGTTTNPVRWSDQADLGFGLWVVSFWATQMRTY